MRSATFLAMLVASASAATRSGYESLNTTSTTEATWSRTATTVPSAVDFDAVFAQQPKYVSSSQKQTSTNRTSMAMSVTRQMDLSSPVTATVTSTSSSLGTTSSSFIPTSSSLKHEPSKTLSIRTKTTDKSSRKTSSTKRGKTTTKESRPKSTLKTSTKKTSSKKKASSPSKTIEAKKVTTKSKPHARRAVATSPCTPQQILYNYNPVNNTPMAFLLDPTLTAMGNALVAPAGYSFNFAGLVGSIQGGNYMTEIMLPSYNVSLCQAQCESPYNVGCNSFNIYFERDPLMDPGVSCPNPAAAVNVVCTLYRDTSLTASMATNIGQWRSSFMTVISGSASFSRNPAPPVVSGFQAPVALPGAVNPASPGNTGSFISGAFTAGTAFNSTICTSQCQSLTSTNLNTAVYSTASTFAPCNYVNAFQVSYSGAVLGTYCTFYSSSALNISAPIYTQASPSGGNYVVSQSYGYAVTNPVAGSNSLSQPFVMQARNCANNAVNGQYLGMQNSTGGDYGIFVSSRAAATEFVINSQTNTLQEWNNNSGYVAALPPNVAGVGGQFFTGPNMPAGDTVGYCFIDTKNNWVACKIPGQTYYDGASCNNDGRAYWVPYETEGNNCPYLYWSPVFVSS